MRSLVLFVCLISVGCSKPIEYPKSGNAQLVAMDSRDPVYVCGDHYEAPVPVQVCDTENSLPLPQPVEPDFVPLKNVRRYDQHIVAESKQDLLKTLRELAAIDREPKGLLMVGYEGEDGKVHGLTESDLMEANHWAAAQPYLKSDGFCYVTLLGPTMTSGMTTPVPADWCEGIR